MIKNLIKLFVMGVLIGGGMTVLALIYQNHGGVAFISAFIWTSAIVGIYGVFKSNVLMEQF